MAGICFIIGIIIADSRDKLLTIGVALVAASVLHNAAGYVLGYFGARLAKLDESSCRTVAIEVGLQNGGMATALAINTLKDPLDGAGPRHLWSLDEHFRVDAGFVVGRSSTIHQ